MLALNKKQSKLNSETAHKQTLNLGGITLPLRNKRFKRKRKNSPHDETKHHRKPKRLGGGDEKNNISCVRRDKHEAWHVLFDSLSAQKMCERVQEYWDIFGTRSMSRHQKSRADEWVRTKKSRIKKREAWQTLFGKRPLEEIVLEINELWIDPAFELVIGIERVQKVMISAKRGW